MFPAVYREGRWPSIRHGGTRHTSGQIVDEHPDLGRDVPALVMHRVHRDVGRPPVGQQRHQGAVGEMRAEHEVGLQHHPRAGHRRLRQHLAVIGRHRAARADADLLRGRSDEAPGRPLRRIGRGEAGMVDQIGGMRGRAALGQIVRRCGQMQADRRQPPGDQGGVGQAADPHGDVVPLLQQVHHPVVHRQVHGQVGIAAQETARRSPPDGCGRTRPAPLIRSRPAGASRSPRASVSATSKSCSSRRARSR